VTVLRGEVHVADSDYFARCVSERSRLDGSDSSRVWSSVVGARAESRFSTSSSFACGSGVMERCTGDVSSGGSCGTELRLLSPSSNPASTLASQFFLSALIFCFNSWKWKLSSADLACEISLMGDGSCHATR